jgi:GH15 family glucan-1,4-alpha-glucosidase
MGRSVMLSNGHLMVGLNESGLVHDFYFPYVGLDNLTTSRSAHHYIGVWVNGAFTWLDDGSWKIDIDLDENALVGKITARNEDLKLELHFQDFVDERYNAFCRRVNISNLADEKREVRLFMHQVFEISRAGRGDTALYVPDGHYILDYKGRISLLIYAEDDNKKPFDQFAVGNYGIENKEGTFRDAEDGELSGNLVEHAGVDSVIRCSVFL